MTIVNPYTDLKKIKFTHTFLRSVVLDIQFLKTDFLENQDKIITFFKNELGIQIDKVSNFITIETEDKSLKIRFSDSNIFIRIDAKIYSSFEDTLLPFLKNAISFLIQLDIKQIKKISIRKENVWHAETNDADLVWGFALRETFKSPEICEFADVDLKNQKPPLKLSKQALLNFTGGEGKVDVSVEIPDTSKFIFKLDISTFADDIEINEVEKSALVLNDIIYGTFIDLVSDKIIKLMEGKNNEL